MVENANSDQSQDCPYGEGKSAPKGDELDNLFSVICFEWKYKGGIYTSYNYACGRIGDGKWTHDCDEGPGTTKVGDCELT